MPLSYTLPRRRKVSKSGIARAPRRTFPTHQAFVRRHSCCVPNCDDGPIRFHHVKTRGAGGGDEYGVSLCEAHHAEIHTIGVETFQERHKVDLWAMAAAFAKTTTDKALRAALRANDRKAHG